jgi:hypothetical protein
MTRYDSAAGNLANLSEVVVSDTPPPYLPPRNVIYFFHVMTTANPISLAGIANLPYTDVIVGFLIPGSTGLTGDESRPQESEQDDKWSFCLTAGTLCPANQERQ